MVDFWTYYKTKRWISKSF